MTEREISLTALIFSLLALGVALSQSDFFAQPQPPTGITAPPILQGYTPPPLDTAPVSAPPVVEVPTIDPIKT